MSYLPKANKTQLSGYVANTYIQNGNWGPWGSVTIAVDDSYFKKGENGQDGQWVDRTYFIDLSVNNKALEKMPNVGKGDFLFIEGKNIEQKKEGDQNNQKPISYKKIEVQAVLMHYPADVAKEMNERAKQQRNQQNNSQGNNYQGNNSNGGNQRGNNNQSGYSQNNRNGGGYSQNNGNGGGYNQNTNRGGYNQNNANNANTGGYQQAPQNGGYQRNQNNKQQQQNGYDQGGPQH